MKLADLKHILTLIEKDPTIPSWMIKELEYAIEKKSSRLRRFFKEEEERIYRIEDKEKLLRKNKKCGNNYFLLMLLLILASDDERFNKFLKNIFSSNNVRMRP